MSNFLNLHYDSESADDEDYNPIEDPEFKKELLVKPTCKSQKSQTKIQEKLSKIWLEMNSHPEKSVDPQEKVDSLMLAKDIIKKQNDEMNDVKTVIFAGSEYLVDKTGTLRLKTAAEQENQKMRVHSHDDPALTNSSINEGNLSLFTNSEVNEAVIESADILKLNALTENTENQKVDLKKRFEYLTKILEKINNRPKVINAVKKSKMDWKQYAKKEQIEDKLERNRKNGLLQKQNFLCQVKENVKNINSDLSRKKVHIE